MLQYPYLYFLILANKIKVSESSVKSGIPAYLKFPLLFPLQQNQVQSDKLLFESIVHD